MEKAYTSYVSLVGMRFVRGFITGAIGAIVAILGTGNVPTADIVSWCKLIGISLFTGGITGGLLAVDKYIRATPDEVESK